MGWLHMEQPWRAADRLYQNHHWQCPECKAAARAAPGTAERCTEGQRLHSGYTTTKDTDMIDALVAGKLHGQPTQRTSKTGKPFAVAKVRVAAGDGESTFISVIAFDDAPCAALLALGDGDSVALSGSLSQKMWTDKEGNTRPSLDLVAHQVLTTYHVTRRRTAMQGAQASQPARQHQRPRDDAWQARAPRQPDLDDGALDF